MSDNRYVTTGVALLLAGLTFNWLSRSHLWTLISSPDRGNFTWWAAGLVGLPTVELIAVLVVLAVPMRSALGRTFRPPLWVFTVLKVVAAIALIGTGLFLLATTFASRLALPYAIEGSAILSVAYSVVSLMPAILPAGALWYLSRAMKRYFAGPGFHA